MKTEYWVLGGVFLAFGIYIYTQKDEKKEVSAPTNNPTNTNLSQQNAQMQQNRPIVEVQPPIVTAELKYLSEFVAQVLVSVDGTKSIIDFPLDEYGKERYGAISLKKSDNFNPYDVIFSIRETPNAQRSNEIMILVRKKVNHNTFELISGFSIGENGAMPLTDTLANINFRAYYGSLVVEKTTFGENPPRLKDTIMFSSGYSNQAFAGFYN
jgi:hypothetical protein